MNNQRWRQAALGAVSIPCRPSLPFVPPLRPHLAGQRRPVLQSRRVNHQSLWITNEGPRGPCGGRFHDVKPERKPSLVQLPKRKRTVRAVLVSCLCLIGLWLCSLVRKSLGVSGCTCIQTLIIWKRKKGETNKQLEIIGRKQYLLTQRFDKNPTLFNLSSLSASLIRGCSKQTGDIKAHQNSKLLIFIIKPPICDTMERSASAATAVDLALRIYSHQEGTLTTTTKRQKDAMVHKYAGCCSSLGQTGRRSRGKVESAKNESTQKALIPSFWPQNNDNLRTRLPLKAVCGVEII